MKQTTTLFCLHDPSYRTCRVAFVGAPQAEIDITELLELLTEGSIWGHQVDFVGALINASNTRVRAFDTSASTKLFTSGEAPDRMHRDWTSLDLLLFRWASTMVPSSSGA